MSDIDLSNYTPQEREEILKILKEYSTAGISQSHEQLRKQDWDEFPVDIHTFLHDKQYLGNALYDAEGRFTLYPYWEEKLSKIFPDNLTTRYNTIIMTGAIGLGKTLVAVIIQTYLLYRLLCLKDPYLYYGLQPIDKLSISMMNITLENAKGVAMDKLNQMLLSSSWFMSHGEMAGVTNLEYRPSKHIEIVAASSNNQIIGRCLYCNFCLTGDTVIKTSEGLMRLDECVGDKLKVYYLSDTGEILLSDFCSVEETALANELIEIELEDGNVIKCTPEHRLMLKDGSYKEAQFLTDDDELMEVKCGL